MADNFEQGNEFLIAKATGSVSENELQDILDLVNGRDTGLMR